MSSKAREEIFRVITHLKLVSFSLIPGLYHCLSIPDLKEKTLEELHTQFDSFRITASQLDSFPVSDSPVCALLTSLLIDLFEDPSDEIRLLSVKILTDLIENLDRDLLNAPSASEVQGKAKLNKYIAPDFENKLIGDIRLLVRKLVGLVLAESEGAFREAAHACLLRIKDRRPLAIAHECVEAKRGGFLKRWEYLDTLLSIPN